MFPDPVFAFILWSTCHVPVTSSLPPFPSCSSPSTALRTHQAKVMELAQGPDTLHKAVPLCSTVRTYAGDGGSSRCPFQMKDGEERGRGCWGSGRMWLPGLGGCLGPGSWGAMWAGREGLCPPGSRLALVGADCVYTFPAHPAHARLLFPGPLPPWALRAICTFAATAAESCLPQPRTPLQKAPRTQASLLQPTCSCHRGCGEACGKGGPFSGGVT